MELGYLVFMVAKMVEWVDFIVNRDDLDIAPQGRQRPSHARDRINRNWSKMHKAALAKAMKRCKSTTDEHLRTNWKLLAKGNLMMDAPRSEMIRDTVLNHLAHHRGQLTVYLRLLSASVPAIYGPSADEGREVFAA